MPVALPTTLDEALRALAASPRATVLAGGTDLMVGVNGGTVELADVVALRDVRELRGVDVVDGSLRIGAMTTYTDLMTTSVADVAPALAQAARTVGSPQIRNAGTIGGNVATASPAGDTLPVLVALGATVEVAGPTGRRALPIGELLTGPKRTLLETGDLVVAVRVPIRRGHQEFRKVGVRNAMVIAVASMAISVDLDERRIGVGLGSVGPVPMAADVACRRLEDGAAWSGGGITASAEVAREFAAGVADAARPIDDHRSTAAYRNRAIEVLAGRCLRAALR